MSEKPKSKPTLQNCAHITTANKNDSNSELFCFRVTNIAKKSIQVPKSVWYLDSCAFQHLTNNRHLFITKLQSKCLNFTTARSQVLKTKRIETIAIPLIDKTSIKLHDVTYAPHCNINLISLGQLTDSKI